MRAGEEEDPSDGNRNPPDPQPQKFSKLVSLLKLG